MKISNSFGINGMKYEIIKAVLLGKILEKYRKDKYWLNIYSELEYEKDLVCSIYLLNSKNNKEIIYQITKSKIDLNKYKDFISNGGKVIEIKLKEFSEDINEIEKKIESLI